MQEVRAFWKWAAIYVLCTLLLGPLFSRPRPCRLYEETRVRQRETVVRLVQEAGGWETLRLECIAWARAHPDEMRCSPLYGGDTEALPPAVQRLKPRLFAYLGEMAKLEVPTGGGPGLIEMLFFGTHRTGGCDEPVYSLLVNAEGKGVPASYRPWSVSGPAYYGFGIQRLAPGVFEIYSASRAEGCDGGSGHPLHDGCRGE